MRLTRGVAGGDQVPVGGDQRGEAVDAAAICSATVVDHRARLTVETVELGAVYDPDDRVGATQRVR